MNLTETPAIDRQFAAFMEKLAGGNAPEIYTASAALIAAMREGSSGVALASLGIDPAALLRFDRVIGRYPEQSSGCPLLIDSDDRLYLQRQLRTELDLVELLKRNFFDSPPPEPDDEDALRRILTAWESQPSADGIEHQKLAVLNAYLNSFAIISGAPGTGKTTVTCALLALELQRAPELRIALAAPSGRAAARMLEALRSEAARFRFSETLTRRLDALEAGTLHRLLGMKYGGGVQFDQGHPLPADLVVVDESSMISQQLFHRLLSAMAPGRRLVLLGDRNQLPAVESGRIFADLCTAAGGAEPGVKPRAAQLAQRLLGVPVPAVQRRCAIAGCAVELDVNYRSKQAPGLVALAESIRLGRDWHAPFGQAVARGELILHCPSERKRELHSVLEELLVPWRELAALGRDGSPEAVRRAFALLDGFRIIAPANRGRSGVESLNREVLKLLGLTAGAAGEPVLILRNDPVTGLCNGDLGFRTGGGAAFPFLAEPVAARLLPEHTTAAAMTVHKTQGAGFGRVLLVLPDEESPLLTRELLYTALTRSRTQVILWGELPQIEHSLAHPSSRTSGVVRRLEEQIL